VLERINIESYLFCYLEDTIHVGTAAKPRELQMKFALLALFDCSNSSAGGNK
jgi:hypothetical protein